MSLVTFFSSCLKEPDIKKGELAFALNLAEWTSAFGKESCYLITSNFSNKSLRLPSNNALT